MRERMDGSKTIYSLLIYSFMRTCSWRNLKHWKEPKSIEFGDSQTWLHVRKTYEAYQDIEFPQPTSNWLNRNLLGGPRTGHCFKCHRWFWCNLVGSWANIPTKQLSSRDESQPLRGKNHTEFCVLTVMSSLKLCSILLKEKKKCGMAKSVNTTCKVPFSPSLTYLPATFGCTYLVTVLQQKPSVGATAKHNPLGKNKVTCRAEGGFTGQSVRGNAFPFTQPLQKTPSEWASALEVPGSPCESAPLRLATCWPLGSPREEEKRGKTHTPCFVLTASQTLGTNSQPQNWLVFHQKHVTTGEHG